MSTLKLWLIQYLEICIFFELCCINLGRYLGIQISSTTFWTIVYSLLINKWFGGYRPQFNFVISRDRSFAFRSLRSNPKEHPVVNEFTSSEIFAYVSDKIVRITEKELSSGQSRVNSDQIWKRIAADRWYEKDKKIVS